MELVQLRLPRDCAERIRFAARRPDFTHSLREFLDHDAVMVADYPMLRDLMWTGRRRSVITAEEAFHVYERNWRFVNPEKLDAPERALIERLTQRYGKGLINA